MAKMNMDDVKQLIDIGKEKGFLSFDEVNDMLPDPTEYFTARPNNGYGTKPRCYHCNATGMTLENYQLDPTLWIPHFTKNHKELNQNSILWVKSGRLHRQIPHFTSEHKELRALIRECRKNKQPYDDLLRALYISCIRTDFFSALSFYDAPASTIANYVDIHELQDIRIDYSVMGYCYVASLLKTDIKWLIEAFGEPEEHQSFDAKWSKIRQNAISRYCSSGEVPFTTLAMALSQMAIDSVPLPVEWALVWALMMNYRAPVKRCPEEFRELFIIRYYDKFGEGLKLEPGNESDLLEVSQSSKSKIGDFMYACSDELDGYSRYLGRNPDDRNSIEAMSYLPPPLLKKRLEKEFQKLTNWLEVHVSSDSPISTSFSSLLLQIPSINEKGFGKKEAVAIANILAKINIGIEPDPRFGDFVIKPGQDVVLFKIVVNASNSPSVEYSAATVVIHLAAAVASANELIDPAEERFLEQHIETTLHLATDEKMRLRAHTQWLLSSYPGMDGVKKRIELLKQDQRVTLGMFLVGFAQANGNIGPRVLNILSKIYEMLGLNPQSLYSHAHTAAVEPVTVQSADFMVRHKYVIPPPPKPVAEFSLDMDSIEAKLAETKAVSAILNNIFSEDEPVPILSPITSDTSIAGLDPESFAFMKALTTKVIWARKELEKLAADHSLMLDGTLDSINDASYDHFGGPFFEGDDPIEINVKYAKELSA